jgi:hypothetical protein
MWHQQQILKLHIGGLQAVKQPLSLNLPRHSTPEVHQCVTSRSVADATLTAPVNSAVATRADFLKHLINISFSPIYIYKNLLKTTLIPNKLVLLEPFPF